MAKEKTAKLIKDVSENFNGIAKLYMLNVPIRFKDKGHLDHYINNENIPASKFLERTNCVVVNQINTENGYDDGTYIFPSDIYGNLFDLKPINGSEKGLNISHKTVLNNAGYKVVD